MDRQRLIKRLTWYYPLEKFHAFVTAPLLLIYANYLFSIKDSVFISYGLLVCIFILYQGQHYWKIKLHRLRNKPIDQQKTLKFFLRQKKINIVLLSAIPAIFLFQLWLNGGKIIDYKILFWGVFTNGFALLEYINYYHIQLMIDNQWDVEYVLKNRKLKTASLANDLRRRKF
ncbi:MAG TPA: hypothetical protein VFF21_09315 [Flavobacteriaceae bacterium]|nr:hypothetical protein [Flavobacteriaceae bacterium]